MPSLLILVPLLGLILLNLPIGRFMRRNAFWFALLLFFAQIVISTSRHAAAWAGRLAPIDSFFRVNLSLDRLTFVMFVCIGVVSFASLLVARDTIPNRRELLKFINLLVIASLGMSGIVMTRDIFSLYVFLEITAMASFILIAFRRDIYALEGAFKYLILSAVATILMLTSIALVLLVSGGTSFAAISGALKSSGSNAFTMLAIGLFICGLFIKGGLVPFHGWLPDAYMSAPGPVSILLAGIVTKVAGIYMLIRITAALFNFSGPIMSVLMLIGTVSMLTGAFAALGQTDFKRMLAYSSISQVGYIVLGVGTGTPLGIAGAVFHLFNHSIFKTLLFVNSAAVEKEVGSSDMGRMGGLSCKMPATGACSVIGFLSTCGIPPMAGFWSKLIIIIALWQSAHYAYAAIAVMASIITLAYLLMMQRKVFFGKLAAGLENIKEAGPDIVVASVILAAITIGVGIFFPAVFEHFIFPVTEMIR